MIFLFWLFSFCVVYAYAGYPMVLKWVARWRRMPDPQKKDITPSVSVVVPAYNEEQAIADKLTTLLALDYPKEQMEIVVVSDCSSDRTDEIVRAFEPQGVRLHRMNTRGGKIAGYKSVLPSLRGEIVVFSDATSQLAVDSLRMLVRSFADQSIGCVAGRLVYIDPKKAQIAQGEQAYWSYELAVKRWEEQVYSLTSVSGTFYGVRKELFPMMMADDLADDLIVVLQCVTSGRRVVLDKDAVCQEFAIHADEAEVTKRWRITVQNLRGLFGKKGDKKGDGHLFLKKDGQKRCPSPFSPFPLPFLWMLVSHKLLRMMVPFFLIGILVTNIFLIDGSAFFKAVLLAQLMFYLCAALASIWTANRPKIFTVMYYFCVTNLAIMLGVIKFFRGERVATWDTQR